MNRPFRSPSAAACKFSSFFIQEQLILITFIKINVKAAWLCSQRVALKKKKITYATNL